MVLATAGTYTILVDPRETYTGTVKVSLDSVPPDQTGTITVDAPATTFTVTKAGQNSKRTFTAVAGQRVSMTASDVAIDVVDISLVRPDGSTVTGRSFSRGQAPFFFDTMVLATAGTYTILV